MRSTTALRRSDRGLLRRTLSTTAALCLAASLAACSGGDDDEPAAGEGSSAEGSAGAEGASDGESAPPPGAPVTGCRATVELTGDVEASWEGKATVRLQDPDAVSASQPDAVYVSESRKQQISVYSEGEEFAAAVTYTDGRTTFASDPEDASGIEARTNGRGATVETTLRDVDENTADIVAEFTCRGGGGKKKNNNDG